MSDSDAQAPEPEEVAWEEQPPFLPERSGDRLLLAALAGSVFLHLMPLLPLAVAMVLGTAGSSIEDRLGDEKGKIDGVNVEIIDAKEYDRRYMSHTAGAGTGSQDTVPAAPVAPPKAEPPPQPAEPKQETPKPPEEAAVAKPEDDALEAAQPQPREQAKVEPAPPRRQERPQPRKPDDVLTEADADQLLRTAQSEFRSIAEATSKASVAAYGSASPAVRAILRKLKSAMPRSPSVRGTLVVRIVLSEKGGVASLGLVQSSGKPDLDKLVLASVRNALSPDPSTNLTPKERLLQITYEYF